MAGQLQHIDASKPHASIIAAIDEDGGVIVDNFISADLHDRLITQLKPHADGYEPGMEGGAVKQMFCGARTKRFSGLVRRAPAFAEIIDNDLFHDCAEHAFRNDY